MFLQKSTLSRGCGLFVSNLWVFSPFLQEPDRFSDLLAALRNKPFFVHSLLPPWNTRPCGEEQDLMVLFT
jgi:hypothetical protein